MSMKAPRCNWKFEFIIINIRNAQKISEILDIPIIPQPSL